MSRAPRAGLNFVEDEQRSMLVAEISQPFEETLGRLVYAALALDGLYEYGGRLRTCHRPCGLQVAEGRVHDGGQHRAEAVLQRGLGGGGQAAVGAAVERFGERQYLVLVCSVIIMGVLAGEFH